jgi:hypothetical protein
MSCAASGSNHIMGRTTPPPAARRGCAAGTSVDPLPYALEARYRLKRGMAWIGYQVHRTEPCDDDPPHVITHGETTLATTADDKMLETIHAALAEHPLLPHEHLVDCGYTDSEILVGSDQAYGGTIVGPVAADPSWQHGRLPAWLIVPSRSMGRPTPRPAHKANRVGSGIPTQMWPVRTWSTSALPNKTARRVHGGLLVPEPKPNRAP